jgi:hypothetical protein
VAKETVDYKAVLDDLQRRRTAMNAQFDAAIVAIRQIATMSDEQPALPGLRSLPLPSPASAPYRGMGMVDAAMRHLSTVKRHVPNLELAAALVSGGFPHKSKNFSNTLNSVLWRRSKKEKDIWKSKNGWGLTEWKRGVSLLPKDAMPDEDEATED